MRAGLLKLARADAAERVVADRPGDRSALAARGADEDDAGAGVGEPGQRAAAGQRFVVGMREHGQDGAPVPVAAVIGWIAARCASTTRW